MINKTITEENLQSQIDCLIHNRKSGEQNGVKFRIQNVSIKIEKKNKYSVLDNTRKEGFVVGDARKFSRIFT